MSENSITSVQQIAVEQEEMEKEKNCLNDDDNNKSPKVKTHSTDDLTSLEQEIAKIHQTDEFSSLEQIPKECEKMKDESQSVNDHNVDDSNNKPQHSKVTPENEKANPNSNNSGDLQKAMDVLTSNAAPLDQYDLIAVLKGLDTAPQLADGSSTVNETVSLKMENDTDESKTNAVDTGDGVTIEGEGEYPIMEVIDDDSIVPENENDAPESSPAPRPPNVFRKRYTTAPLLTAEAERALALEQMAYLKTDRTKRRKQDFKPIQQSANNINLVSSLGDEWSDEDIVNSGLIPKSTSSPTCHSNISKSDNISSSGDSKIKSQPEITSVVVIPPPQLPISADAETVQDNCSANIKETVDFKVPTVSNEQNQQTGFRRTRIIKRKIIWDPDAPETTFSYAKLVKSSNNQNQTAITKTMPKTQTQSQSHDQVMNKGAATINLKKSTSALTRKMNQTTPKNGRKSVGMDNKTIEKKNNALSRIGNKQVMVHCNNENDISGQEANKEETRAATPVKKRSQTPTVSGRSSVLKKKKLSEIEILMSDEGAFNMLNSLEHERNATNIDSTTRPLMRSRSTTMCDKAQRREGSITKAIPSSSRCITPITPCTSTRTTATKGKRTPRSKASATWDYVYNKQKEIDDSMIIRRRSNSSYSSNTSIHHLSLDSTPTQQQQSTAVSSKASSVKGVGKSNNNNNTKISANGKPLNKRNLSKSKLMDSENQTKNLKSTMTNESKAFEFAKPENKPDQRNNKRRKSPAAAVTLANDLKKVITPSTSGKRNARSPATIDTTDTAIDIREVKSNLTYERSKEYINMVTSTTNTGVVVKKSAKVAQIIFNTNKSKLNNTFTIQMLNKLIDILGKLHDDDDCHAVVMYSVNSSFCQGIDFTDLKMAPMEKRKSVATALGSAVKNYLKALVKFSKPLLAAVNGHNINFGVTQLALFDVVIAGDKSSFETHYVKLGQIPEGYCIWNSITKIQGSCATKLFWLNEKLSCTAVSLFGLITKFTVTTKVNEEAVNIARKIAALPPETYRAMKRSTFQNDLHSVLGKLDDEFDAIINQWTTNDCFERIKKYVESGYF